MHFIYRYTCLCVGLRHVYSFYLYWRVFSMQFIKTCYHFPNYFIKITWPPFTHQENGPLLWQRFVHLFYLNEFCGSRWFMLLLSFYSMKAHITGWQFIHHSFIELFFMIFKQWMLFFSKWVFWSNILVYFLILKFVGVCVSVHLYFDLKSLYCYLWYSN